MQMAASASRLLGVAPFAHQAIWRLTRELLQPGVGMAGRTTEGHRGQRMTSEPGPPPSGPTLSGGGLDAVMLANRAALLRFLASHGTGEDAEDLFHELWLRVSTAPAGPVGNPLAYLYRAANNLAIDRHRSLRQAQVRDKAWAEVRGESEMAPAPGADRQLISREELARTNAVLAELGERASFAVRRFRLDGIAQSQIAAELGVSLSTVESDLRRAYAALLDARRRFDD